MPSEDPNHLTPVQQLLRLKRHETPGEDFVEDFLRSFKERQRAELLKQSARSLLWERWTTYWDNRVSPKWALTGVAAILVLGFAWVQLPAKLGPSPAVAQGAPSTPGAQVKANEVTDKPAEDFPVDMVVIMGRDVDEPIEEEPQLLSRHFSGGYADEARQVKSKKKPQGSVNIDLQMQSDP